MKGIQRKVVKLCEGRERNSSHDNPVTRDCFHIFCCGFLKVWEGNVRVEYDKYVETSRMLSEER